MELAEQIWAQIGPTVFVSKNEFMRGLDGFDLTAISIDDTVVGATLVRGPEFHFISFGRRKAVSPALVVKCLQPILDKCGCVKTRTPKEDARQHRFNVLLGFVAESTDEFYTYFRLERLNLRGAKRCLS